MLRAQPKGLYLLFFTEVWERFGFMCLQTIFVLYLSHVFHYSDQRAYLLLGVFGAFQWLSPVPGGFLADRFFGFQRAIIIGGTLLAMGYFISAAPTHFWFLIGLGFLILGNGLFKPNVSSIVGTLYAHDDPRRDSGFTIFYMGINLGQLIPPLFIGTLVAKYGWDWGFILSAIGMLISLLTFLLGRKRLQQHGTMPEQSILRDASKAKTFNVKFMAACAAVLICSYFILLAPQVGNIIFIIASIIILFVIIRIILRLETKDRNNMLVCVLLTIISIGFWAIYMQCFSSLMLFADRNLDLHFMGFTIHPELTQMFNPLFIILLAPVLSYLWPRLNRRKMNPSYPTKFALGTLFMALGLLQLAFCIKVFGHHGYTNTWWLVLSYLLQTVGELVLSPIGLAMITVLAPKKYVGMMMGVWFLALAASFAIGGELATIADVPKHASILLSQSIYTHAFFDYGWMGIGLTLVAFFATPKLKKMITH